MDPSHALNLTNPDGDLDTDYVLDDELRRLRKDGSLIKLKARMGLEASLDVLIRKLLNLELPDAMRLQIFDRLVKLAGLDVPAPIQASAGATFAVQIVMPPGAQVPATASPIVHLAGQSPTDKAPVLDQLADRDLPPIPAYLRRGSTSPETIA